jgi:hypothetical protein
MQNTESEMESGKKLRLPDPIEIRISGWAKEFGQKEIRFHNDIANDVMRSVGRMKIWNSYPPNEFEKIFTEQGLIPIGYYYSTFDVETDELVFLSQEKYITKFITRLRWKINKWFIKRNW